MSPPIRIWVIDDNEPDIFLIEMALKQSGLTFQSTAVGDGCLVFAMIKECKAGIVPHPHMILLDLNLPKASGIEILRAVRAAPELSAVRVAILSSSPEPYSGKNLEGLQVDRYIQKPAHLNDFIHEIAQGVKFLATLLEAPRGDRYLGDR